jgi:hypothetical protein
LGLIKYKVQARPTSIMFSMFWGAFLQIRDAEKDEFLVLACDGVWDVMTNEDICSFISARSCFKYTFGPKRVRTSFVL